MIKIYDEDVLKLGYDEPFYQRDVSSITEQAGYVDAETQVKRMLVAGANLQDFRRGLKAADFEYPDGVVPDDVKPDPTFDVGFDLADASSILANTEEKLAFKKAEFENSKVSKKVNEGTEETVAET